MPSLAARNDTLHRHGRQGRQPKALADLCVLEDGGRDGIEIQGGGRSGAGSGVGRQHE